MHMCKHTYLPHTLELKDDSFAYSFLYFVKLGTELCVDHTRILLLNYNPRASLNLLWKFGGDRSLPIKSFIVYDLTKLV